MKVKNKILLPNSAAIAPLNVTARSAAPTSPVTNDIYLDNGTNTASGEPGWRAYNGTSWDDVGALSGGGFPWTYWFWDDFVGKIIDTTNWWTDNDAGTGDTTINNNHLNMIGAAYFSAFTTNDVASIAKIHVGNQVKCQYIVPTLIIRAQANGDYNRTQETIEIGFSNTGGVTAAANAGACFRHDVTTASGNWYAVSSNGSSEESTDTGIAINTTPKNFKIVWENSGSIKFYINGVLKATHTTYVPGNAVEVSPYIYLKNKDTNTKAIMVDYVKVLSTANRGTE